MKTLKLRLAACTALVLGLVFAASSATYYVDASRPDNDGDGLSEATAKRYISAAINISAAGDLILVKPGTYTSTLSGTHLDHALTIRATEGPEKTFIRTESQAIDTFNGTKEPVFDGFTVSSKGDDWSIWGGTYTNCVIAFCRGKIGGAKFFSSTIACNDLALRCDAVIGPDCLVWGNPVKTETAPDPYFVDPENFDFRLRAFSPEAYTNPRLGYYQGPLVEGRFVRVAVDGVGELEGDLVNLVADGGSITLKCATTSPRPVVRWLDENGAAIADGGDYEFSADSLTIKNVTADRRITACIERKTWYVNADTGDDAGKDGLSEGNPFKTITKALASAIDLDTILVAKGTYAEGCDAIDHNKYPKLRVTDGRRLTIRATGARAETIIDGGNETSCLWLNDKQTINTNVVVDGFTLQNGQASWLTGVGAIGGGAFGGLLRNCTIRNCTSGSGDSGGGGGAAFARLENCTVTGCKAHSEGGALRGCDAEGCVIRGNSMGGTSSFARGCATVHGTLVNCLIADNEFESTVVSGSGAVYQSELYGCTVAGNRNNASSNRNGAGVYGESSYTKLFNTIVYGNVSDGQPDELQNVDSADLATCCTNDPSFVNVAGGDYRLLPTSVCHNAGKNSYVIGAYDLAGKARIQEWTVDLGAYEYCPVMTITAAPTPATAGTAYSYTLTQTGGTEPVAWTIDDAIPEGISLSGNQLVGTPAKGGTYRFRVTTPAAPGFTLDTGTAPVEDLKAQIVQGANQNFAIATSEGAKVTAAGLPTGLKLVQNKTTKLYTVEGIASKPGEYFVTFKTTLNGVTTVTTTAFTVKGNPFTAAYYGCALARPATNEAYRLAVAEVTVAAAGTVTLTYTEGKTKYTASVKSFDWNDTTDKGTAEGLVLKVSSADKKLGYGDRKATVTLEDCGVYLRAKLIVNDANGSQIGESIGGMYATVKTTEVPLPASQTFVFRTEDGADTNAFATVSLAYDAKKATAAFSGKLYDGTAVKATVPVMRWDDDGKAWDYAFAPFLVVAKDGTVCCFNCFTDDDGGCINWVCDDGEWTEGVWSPDVDYPHADKKFAELVPEEGAFTFGWGSDAEIVGAAEESFMFEQTLDAKGKPAGVAIYDADAVEGEKPLATVTAKVGKATGAISVSFTSKKGDKAKYAVELVWRGEQIFAGHVTRTWKGLDPKTNKSVNKTAYGTAEVK